MAQVKFHVTEGIVQKCRPFSRCKAKEHWAEAEHARIHLDNIAFRAEVEAKVANFQAIKRNLYHPQHFRAIFSAKDHSDSVRKFRDSIDHYVAQHGELPAHLVGSLRYRLKHWQWRHEIFFEIEVNPEIDAESGRTSRRWTAKVTELDETQYLTEKKHNLIHEVELAFDDHRDFEDSLDKLRAAYVIALKATGKHHLDNYSGFTEPMIKKFWEMFDAIEGVTRGDWKLWYDLGRGYFKESTDDKIIVDVNYDKSALTGQSFSSFAQEDSYYDASRLTDAEIRLTDEVEGHPRASWSLYRKDRIWSVATRTFEGDEQDNLTSTAEKVRSHVYWHVIREVNPDKQDIALKKAQDAADLFTAVENALAKNHDPLGA